MQPLTLQLLFCLALLVPAVAPAHDSDGSGERLPTLGAAAGFTLTTQNGERLSLSDLHGKVIAISFIFTTCADVCPLLTAKLVGMQKQLGSAFGTDVYFLSVTVDPEYDTPEVLKSYAAALGCDPAGWALLTGTVEEILDMARSYGVYHEKQAGGSVDHNLLTSIVDRNGMLRVQYMGERFDADEFLHDLRDLMAEDSSQ
jgi:protein SCO1/2